MNRYEDDLTAMANMLLRQNGYTVTGAKVRYSSKGQSFFEKRIIKTPMGNRTK